MEPENYFPKEYSIGEILSEAWQRFTGNFWPILLIALLFYVPIEIISLVLAQNGMALKIIKLAEGLISIVPVLAIAYLISSRRENRAVDFGEALNKAFSRWSAAIGTNILLNILLIGLFLLLVVPGIIYSVYWMFASYAVILRNKSGKDALDYSKSIVKGRWWTVAWYNFVITILTILIAIPVGIFYAFLPDHYLVTIAMNITIDIIISFLIVASTIFFLNFDSTKEITDKIELNDKTI